MTNNPVSSIAAGDPHATLAEGQGDGSYIVLPIVFSSMHRGRNVEGACLVEALVTMLTEI